MKLILIMIYNNSIVHFAGSIGGSVRSSDSMSSLLLLNRLNYNLEIGCCRGDKGLTVSPAAQDFWFILIIQLKNRVLRGSEV